MARVGVVLCAFLLSGCNSVLPGLQAPDVSAPLAQAQSEPDEPALATGSLVAPPLADLDCAPRAGAITCP